MTTLPAIRELEAEALAVAKEWFRQGRAWRGGDNPLTAHSPLTVESGRAWTRHILRTGAAGPVNSRLQLVAIARAGEPDAHAVVMQRIFELQSSGKPLPAEFAAYSMDHAAGLLRSHQSSGPKRKDRMTRDWFIAVGVALLLDRFGHRGLLPTRNTEPSNQGGKPSARLSACDIIAAVSGEMGHKRVEQIWNRLKGGMPTVPGWSANY